MSFKYVKDKTRGIRHRIVKLIAPNLYHTYSKIKFLCDMSTLVPRGSTKYIIENGFKSNLICEIGVSRGNNTLNLIRELKPKTIYLVDPYSRYVECDEILDEPDIKFEMLNRLSQYMDRIVFVNRCSQYCLDYDNCWGI